MPYILSTLLGIFSGLTFKYFPIFSTLLALMPALFCIANKRYKLTFLCLMISMAGFLYGYIVEIEEHNNPEVIKFKGYILHRANDIYLFKKIEGQKIKVYYKNELTEGRLYNVECKRAQQFKNPYIFSNQDLCYPLQIADEGEFKLNIFDKVRKKINDELSEKLNKNNSSVMIAMTTGYRYEIPRQIRDDFQKTGLIHLLSISGAHFSLLFTVFFIIFKFLTRFIPYKWLIRLTLYIKPSQLSLILCFPVLLFYYLLIEPNYPSTRAFIMAIFFMVGVLTERRFLWIITVSIACVIILLVDPSSARELSFQLSFLATVAIGFVTDIYKSLKDRIKRKFLSYLILSLLISLSASLITAPVVIYRFHYFSLISPFANLTAGLLIGMLLFPLNIIFVFIFLITGVYPMPEIINLIANFSFNFMHLLASFSFSSLTIPPIPLGAVVIFYLATFLSIFTFYGLKGWFKKISLALSSLLIFMAILISLALHNSDKQLLKITFLDVGQADSAVIESPDGIFLIDTGKTGFQAENYLKAKANKYLNALVITHEQKDHAGGILSIIENLKINEIWDNGYVKYNYSLPIYIRHLERGDILKTNKCTFTVLHPYRGFYSAGVAENSNELSIVLRLKCHKKIFLFTSDAGKDALKSIPLDYLKADVVKIPHHGSKSSFYMDFYKAVSPQICVFSVGKNNPYGHPYSKILEFLKDKCEIYRTDVDGAIQIEETKEGNLTVKTFEQTKLKPYREWENLKKLFILW